MLCDKQIRRTCQSGLDESSPFVIGSAVVGSDGAKKITLRLIRHHFEKVGQMFTFRSQLHDRVARQGLQGIRLGNAARCFSRSSTCCMALSILSPNFP